MVSLGWAFLLGLVSVAKSAGYAFHQYTVRIIFAQKISPPNDIRSDVGGMGYFLITYDIISSFLV